MRLFPASLLAMILSGCGAVAPSQLSAVNGLSAPPIGKLCTASDPNFDEFRYPSHIAHCRRNVPTSLREAVAKRYDVPAADYHLYEFDHYIPLNAGGADDIDNLWPEPLAEARQKDRVELEIFNALSAGTMTQDQAIATVKAWHPI